MMPADWRTHMVAMIRGRDPLSGEWFTGSAGLSPEQQIGVYAEQYRLRIWDALVEEIPGLLHLLGDDAEDILWRFLADHPPAHWSIGRVADGLADWLEQQGEPEVHVDMARLDAAVMCGFLAADGHTPRPDELAGALSGALRLRLQPHVSLLVLRTNVHLVRSAVISDEVPPAVAAGAFHVAVFRVDRAMRHTMLDRGAHAALAAIGAGRTVADAVAAAAEADPNAGTRLARWFAGFVERGLVEIG